MIKISQIFVKVMAVVTQQDSVDGEISRYAVISSGSSLSERTNSLSEREGTLADEVAVALMSHFVSDSINIVRVSHYKPISLYLSPFIVPSSV